MDMRQIAMPRRQTDIRLRHTRKAERKCRLLKRGNSKF